MQSTRYFFPLASVLVLLGVAACREDTAPAGRAEIAQLHAKIPGWYAGGVVDSLTDLYTADARIFSPNAPPVVGHDSITAHFQRLLPEEAKWDVVLNTQTLEVAGDAATEYGTYTIEVLLEGMETPKVDRGHYILVWRRDPEGWKIRYDMAMSERAR